MKVYFYKNDKQIIERFEKEDGLFGGNFSHITKKPSTYIYEAVEDVILLRLKYRELAQLTKKYHDIERLYRIILELFHLEYVERFSSFKSLSSAGKYSEFVKLYGDIANRVSMKDIASFLDITPETLSRIRAKFDK